MDRLTYTGQCFATMAEAMYVDRMTIRRQTSIKGSAGGNIPGVPEVLATNVPCRLRPATANERELAGQTQASQVYVVRAPVFQGTDLIEIDARCELVIAAREGGIAAQTLKAVVPLPNNGILFEVVATKQA